MPSLPHELVKRFIHELNLPEYDAYVLTDSKEIALYFEELCKHTTNYKSASNWVMGPVKSYLNELTLHIHQFPVKPIQLAELIKLIDENKISYTSASQKIYPVLLEGSMKTPLQIAEELNLIQESDENALIQIIDEVIALYPEKVIEYKNGKKGLLGLFMGEIMKKTKGKADPKRTSELLNKKLLN